ncbi:MAG: NusG domain II-containing protein [Clostridia bacterium]|nr:NusG domain II-containing protein [Clostridia bacterium]
MNGLFEKIKYNKPFKKSDIIVIILLILILLAVFLALSSHRQGEYAYIYSQNKLIKVMPLDTDDEFIFNYDSSNKNIITVSGGKISVTYSDCKDKICVSHAPVSTAGSSIICLPHSLFIIIRGEAEIDAVVYTAYE